MTKTCPKCGYSKYITSIFGEICGHCFYVPPRDGAKYHR